MTLFPSILYLLIIIKSSAVPVNINLTNWSSRNASECSSSVLCKCLEGNDVFEIADAVNCSDQDICTVHMAKHCDQGPASQTSQCSYYNPQTPKGLPNVTSEQRNRNMFEGDDVVIPCNIDSNPPACVTWLFNGKSIQKLIKSNFYGAIPRIDYSPPNSTLKLYSIKPDLHRGQYTCHASNAVDQKNYTFNVNVEAKKKRKPTIRCADNKESYLGSSFNITCIVNYPYYPYLIGPVDYRRGGRRVDDDSRHELYQNPNDINQFKMMIKNVSHEDAGTWELYAHNRPNHPEIKNITIQVVPCPRGFYCPLNESTPRPCPPRTYNDGTTNITYSCKACPNVFTSNKNLFPSGAESIEDCPKTDKPDPSLDRLVRIISAVVIPTAVVTVVVCVLSYLRRKRRNLPWQVLLDDTVVTEMEIIYDVFLSFSNNDHEFGQTLQSTLEEQGYKCCFHYRDFEPGQWIVQNITDAIYKSKVTLVVLSPSYIASRFCKQELRQALTAVAEQRRVLPVIYKKCRCPREIRSCLTYLEFKPDQERHFWSKLFDALQRSCGNGINCESQV